MVTTNSTDRARTLEELSAFADGELEDGRVAQACQHWRVDREWRASWHAYHLIGDVLRSDDLAGSPALDARFLSQLRARLAEEPVVLAPSSATPLPSPASFADAARGHATVSPGARRAWKHSSAVAVVAGFVVVAGVLFATRVPDGAAPSFASASTAGQRPVAADAIPVASTAELPAALPSPVEGDALAAANPRASAASGKLIRDVRLDRYLAAHKEFAGSSALGVPSGFLRNATADLSDR